MLPIYESLRSVKNVCTPRLRVVFRIDAVISLKIIKFTVSDAILHSLILFESAVSADV